MASKPKPKRRRRRKSSTVNVDAAFLRILEQELIDVHKRSGYALALLRQFGLPEGSSDG